MKLIEKYSILDRQTDRQTALFRTIGASSHAIEKREINDYYATHPLAVRLLLEKEMFADVLEPACGEGHISKELINLGVKTTSFDLIDRGFGEVGDFFDIEKWHGDIVTNPPYKIAKEFIEHGLDIIPNGRKIAMFLKLQFLEGQARRKFFEINPPRKVYVCSKRIVCAKNGEFERFKSTALAHAWFVWEKGFSGRPEIDWIN